MTSPTTDELKKLALAATPGPWKVGYDDGSGVYYDRPGDHADETFCLTIATDDCVFHAKMSDNPNDSSFIAAANPQTVLALIDELEKARAEIEDLKASLNAWEHGL